MWPPRCWAPLCVPRLRLGHSSHSAGVGARLPAGSALLALQADLLAVTLVGPQGPAVAPHSPVSGRVVAKCQPHIFPQGSPAWSLQRSSWVLPFLAWCPVSGPQFFHLWNGRGGWVGREDPEDGPRSVGAASACIPPPCSPFSRPLPGPAQCWGRAPAQQVPTGRLMLGGGI